MTPSSDIKKMIKKYLTISVKSQFNIDINLEKEYALTENLVSKKTIIAPTFTKKILSKPGLKLFLTSLITEINNERCSIEFILEKMKSLRGNDFQQMQII
ncbi:hypothetical protein SAMN06264346_11571 [Chryseobacterium profundimaris]|uniref:Uncharacterized protein n=2 Tax=Chryseobacterium profundimaris TaxID=1387275 RepID=A0ABY1PHM5_9FLAO|nr:hypothetical protein SAMN06264346_11571 [Chryseobacterium profundimaris]